MTLAHLLFAHQLHLLRSLPVGLSTSTYANRSLVPLLSEMPISKVSSDLGDQQLTLKVTENMVPTVSASHSPYLKRG